MWDAKHIQEAFVCVRRKTRLYTRAAKIFKIPRTTFQKLAASNLSLEAHVNMKLGRKPIVPPEMEAQLVDYLLAIENQFYGLTRSDGRKMAYHYMAQLAIRNNLKHLWM